jgi:retinol dehydrogenase-12
MGTFAGFFYRQLTIKPKPLPPNVRLDGKTAIITGANAGLGLEAAKELATHGLTRIILAVRSVSKGEAAKEQILAANPAIKVQVWSLTTSRLPVSMPLASALTLWIVLILLYSTLESSMWIT